MSRYLAGKPPTLLNPLDWILEQKRKEEYCKFVPVIVEVIYRSSIQPKSNQQQ